MYDFVIICIYRSLHKIQNCSLLFNYLPMERPSDSHLFFLKSPFLEILGYLFFWERCILVLLQHYKALTVVQWLLLDISSLDLFSDVINCIVIFKKNEKIHTKYGSFFRNWYLYFYSPQHLPLFIIIIISRFRGSKLTNFADQWTTMSFFANFRKKDQNDLNCSR